MTLQAIINFFISQFTCYGGGAPAPAFNTARYIAAPAPAPYSYAPYVQPTNTQPAYAPVFSAGPSWGADPNNAAGQPAATSIPTGITSLFPQQAMMNLNPNNLSGEQLYFNHPHTAVPAAGVVT